MKNISEWQWQFGGGLQGLSVPSSWGILVGAFLLGAGLIYLSYGNTLTKLSLGQRWILSALRLGFLGALLLCLANPVRVQRVLLDPPRAKPLAVVVDRSESMTMKDNRGKSRLDLATRVWEKLRPSAEKHFSTVDFYAFAQTVAPARSWAEVGTGSLEGEETFLFDSLASVLASAPAQGYGGVLCLTDGLDTSTQSTNILVQRALATRTPLYFLTTENRRQAKEYCRIREVTVPSQALRRTQINYQAVIEAYLASEQTVPLVLKAGGTELARETLTLRSGQNLVPWSQLIETGEVGNLLLELELGTGATLKHAIHPVRVIEKIGMQLLYYQGALDWGFHFLNRIFQRDPSFRVTSLFNPGLGTKLQSGTEVNRGLTDLPNSPQELAKYQLVLLDNVFVSQLSALQQQALLDYARSGGALLFILPNNRAAQAFAGSKLEEMLPVVFESGETQTPQNRALDQFQRSLAYSGSISAGEAASVPVRPLTPFAFPAQSRVARVFTQRTAQGEEAIVPQFVDYALVARAKPAAEVWATHPTEKNPITGEARILLASQPFGQGRASVLTTDSLWRWRLTLPSDSMAPAIFWQQLVLSLAPGSTMDTLRFMETGTEVPVNQVVTLTLIGGETAPAVTVTGADQKSVVAAVSATSEPGQWKITWTPAQPGLWVITARTSGGESVAKYLTVTTSEGTTKDRANQGPDWATLQQLASVTGGEVLTNNAVPAAWTSEVESAPPQVLSERRELLWNQGWWLALGLFFYASELVLRRWWKLL